MTEEGDIDVEEIIPSENNAIDVPKNKDSQILKSSGDQAAADEENVTKPENKENSHTKEECEEKDLEEGPPTFEESDFRWGDNYTFVEDEKPVDFNEKDPKKLILWAAQKDELETLRKLLEVDPSLVNARDNDLYTPLHRASYNNNVEVIGILLSYDADISAKTVDGWQPLHCACKWDSVEAVSVLIQNGADVNAQTNGHITPLHLAASNVYGRRTLELLLWHPYIDPNVKNDGGDTAYDIACRTGPWGALFEILEESVNVY